MRSRVQKWGNSLAIRIPKAIAVEAGLDRDALVELTLDEGRVTIAPVLERTYELEQLLAGVTDENIHAEVDTGPAVGDEFP